MVHLLLSTVLFEEFDYFGMISCLHQCRLAKQIFLTYVNAVIQQEPYCVCGGLILPPSSMNAVYAILNNDYHNDEWGYFVLSELCEVKAGGFVEVDRYLHFTPTKAGDFEKILRGGGV